MRKLSSFIFLSLNGFFKGPGENTSWHQHGSEENKFSEEQLQSGNILLFGRKTYEMMYSFWPTPLAAQSYPVVATGMNNARKIVFSNSLKSAEWKHTKIINGDIVSQIKNLKETSEKDMTILGSGSIVTQFSDGGLIDEYQIMIDPVAITEGTSLFNGLKKNLELKLAETKVFKSSGVVLLRYVKQN